jgi:formylglycine-generating enzyme required for sulfatase activity
MIEEQKNILFGKIAIKLGFVTEEGIRKVLINQETDSIIGIKKHIGTYLFEEGLITKEQIHQILQLQKKYIEKLNIPNTDFLNNADNKINNSSTNSETENNSNELKHNSYQFNNKTYSSLKELSIHMANDWTKAVSEFESNSFRDWLENNNEDNKIISLYDNLMANKDLSIDEKIFNFFCGVNQDFPLIYKGILINKELLTKISLNIINNKVIATDLLLLKEIISKNIIKNYYNLIGNEGEYKNNYEKVFDEFKHFTSIEDYSYVILINYSEESKKIIINKISEIFHNYIFIEPLPGLNTIDESNEKIQRIIDNKCTTIELIELYLLIKNNSDSLPDIRFTYFISKNLFDEKYSEVRDQCIYFSKTHVVQPIANVITANNIILIKKIINNTKTNEYSAKLWEDLNLLSLIDLNSLSVHQDAIINNEETSTIRSLAPAIPNVSHDATLKKEETLLTQIIGLSILFLLIFIIYWAISAPTKYIYNYFFDTKITIDLGGGVTLEMVKINAAGQSFKMGSSSIDEDLSYAIVGVHTVSFSKDYFIGKYEITQGQWKSIMNGQNPSHFKNGDNYPVENISWNDICGARGFLEKLNMARPSGYIGFRLPTEAEWEYAARAGTKTRFYWGDDPSDTNLISSHAWYQDNSSSKTHPVGKKLPNSFGLYDMPGNVSEWCRDWYGIRQSNSVVSDPTGPASGSYRVMRGGDWSGEAWCCRSAYGSNTYPHSISSKRGFRLALPSSQ